MSLKMRRTREKEIRREQILDAARSLLFEKGMASLSMSQIAQLADLSVGALYLYFKNKEDLFAALQEEGLSRLYESVFEAQNGNENPEEKLRSIALAYMDFSEQYRKYFEIINYFLTSPGVKFPDELKARIDTQGGKILALVESALRDCLPMEKSDQSRKRAIHFWALCHGMLDLRKLKTTILAGQPFRDLYQESIENFIEALW
jgi:AcrR family transcriptional regulator